VQLVSRHWKIVDANGRTEEVKGPGVVGEQPVLHQGERFEYTSGVPLKTPSGVMSGTYQMITEDGDDFDAEVPAFSLDAPSVKRVVHYAGRHPAQPRHLHCHSRQSFAPISVNRKPAGVFVKTKMSSPQKMKKLSLFNPSRS
jgi:hypothetical protein